MEGRSGRENVEADRSTASLQRRDDEINTEQDDLSSKPDWTTEATQEERATRSGCRFNDLRSDDHRPAERSLSREEESAPGPEDPCPASVHEYLDSCFPAAQPEKPEPEPEPPHGSKHRSSPAVPPLSTHTHYLTTWTLSQALILRGRRGVQSAASPEKTPPPQTPPKHAQTPPSVSSSTPELFSPVTPSPGASAELFSQPCPTPRAEQGGVVVEATADGVLCSQEAERQAAQDSPCKSPDVKRARISENIRTEASVAPSTSAAAAAGLRGPTTPLSRCDKRGVQYSVLVAVVHPCHLKEVKVSDDTIRRPSRSHKIM